ncbi:organic cation transporter isoform X1, partial [Brachionus plicatilis]
ILFNWLANTFVYYGISYNTSDLAGDPYLNFGLSALVELVAILTSHFVLERFGRKIPYSMMMATTGICFISVLFIPKNLGLLVTGLTLVSKFAISFSYNTIYIITAECHPTVIRNSSLAICQTFSRIGTIISPNIQLLGEIFWYPLPFLIYGSISSGAVILFIIFMPETRNQKLPDTINEFVKDE